MQVGSLDPAALQARVDDVAAQAYKLSKARPSDEVVAALQKSVDSFKAQLPVLQEVPP